MIFDDLAAQIEQDYELLLFALNGRYQQFRAPGTAVTPLAVSTLEADARRLVYTFTTNVGDKLERYAWDLKEGLTDGAQASIAMRFWSISNLIADILADNLRQVSKMTRTGMTGVADILRGSTGAIGNLVQRKVGQIQFRANDTAGRNWSAKVLFKTVVRDFAYQSWLDAEMDKYMSAGHDLMETSKGDVFSLLGTEGHSYIGDVRHKFFHPNSHNIMVPHVSS